MQQEPQDAGRAGVWAGGAGWAPSGCSFPIPGWDVMGEGVGESWSIQLSVLVEVPPREISGGCLAQAVYLFILFPLPSPQSDGSGC